ncbi:MAG: glycosyltransferase [Actinomycetota bacterium]|nr:glycosyltransferase [Actinomycetota bacterium]
MSLPKLGVVLLTMGRRPEELARGLASLQSQVGVELDIVVVGNGWQPVDLPAAVKALYLEHNLGIPAGRNAGVAVVQGELLFFLDDDAALADAHFLATIAQRFAADPQLGLLQPRVVDPAGLAAPARWVPRLRVGDPAEPGPATSLWEGAVAIRRDLFDRIGGWPDEFFYAHEGIDLVWRVWDEGFTPWYAGDLEVHHPVIDPARHVEYYRLNARNRVWLARRNLPLVLEPIYVGTWVGMTLLRVHDRQALRAWFGGMSEGMRVRPKGRRVMHWSTVWAMTKAGRPPVI